MNINRMIKMSVRILEKMTTTWFKEFKESISTAKFFFEERKKGQFNIEETGFLSFIDFVLNNEGDAQPQIDKELRTILSKKENTDVMMPGLSMPRGKSHIPGDFWLKPDVFIAVCGTNQEHRLGFNEIFTHISGYSILPKPMRLPSDVVNYMVGAFTRSFCAFIPLLKDHEMPAVQRSLICKNSAKTTEMAPPYSGQKGELIKVFLKKGMQYPLAQRLIKENLGESMPGIINDVVEDFNPAKVAILQNAAAQSMATGDLAPIIAGFKSVAGDAIDTLSAKEDGHCCEQD